MSVVVRHMQIDGKRYAVVHVANDCPRHAIPVDEAMTFRGAHRLKKGEACGCKPEFHSNGLLLHKHP